MTKTTKIYLPALFLGLLAGACSGEKEPAPISTQNAALVQKAATQAVTGLQEQLTADILAMINGGSGTLLVGDLSSFSVDTSLSSQWGGALAVKGMGVATTASGSLDLQLTFDQYTDQAGVVLNGVMEMKSKILSFDPLDLTITLKGVFDMIDEVEQMLEDIEMDLDINISDVESYVCGLIEAVDISDVLCGSSGGVDVTCDQAETNACASDESSCMAACNPVSGYEACAKQCTVDFCTCLEQAGCQDATQSCDVNAGGGVVPDEQLPGEEEIPQELCSEDEANACSSTYNVCVNDCDPLDEYQVCVAECTDDFCLCLADADCKDQSGRCLAQ